MVVEGCGGARLTHQTVAVTKKQRGLVSRIAISVKLEKASVRSPFTTGLQHVLSGNVPRFRHAVTSRPRVS